MNRLEHIYLSRDPKLLTGVSSSIASAWRAHWAGDFIGALTYYESASWESLPDDIRALVAADRILLRVKRGAGFEEINPNDLRNSLIAHFVYQYAKFTWAFWVDHRVAWQCLRDLFWLSLRIPARGATAMTVFLMVHLWAIRGTKWLPYLLAKLCFHRFLRDASVGSNPFPFFQNIVFAAFPYTLVVTGLIDRRLPIVVSAGERFLPNDPYYVSLFQVSCLYGFAYTSDVPRAEFYAELMRKQNEAGKLLRYMPLTQVMPLLPIALRGYSHLVYSKLAALAAAHVSSAADPLINSQFYRVCAIIALCHGENRAASDWIELAIEYRKLTRSFQAWSAFDENVKSLAGREVPFDPRRDHLLKAQSQFELPPQLGSFLVDLTKLTAQAASRGERWLTASIVRALAEHVGWDNYQVLAEIPQAIENDPMIRVGKVFLLFRGYPELRVQYLRELLSSISPIIESFLLLSREQSRVRELEREAAIGRVAEQVAHDIGSPLTALEMALATLGSADEERVSLMKIAIKRIRSIALDLSMRKKKGSASFLGLEASPIRVFEDVIREKRLELSARPQVKLMLDANGITLGHLPVESKELKRALSNLINNAAEAIHSEGCIEVVAQSARDRLEISVNDNGVGIPEEIFSRVGLRGFSHGKSKGSGLGVAHAKEMVERAGGKFEITSRVGVGTRIRFSLPIRSDEAVALS